VSVNAGVCYFCDVHSSVLLVVSNVGDDDI